jgi:transposase
VRVQTVTVIKSNFRHVVRAARRPGYRGAALDSASNENPGFLRRPSIDPELMLRMPIVGYCYGIRFERKLCEDVELHLAYRWFCRLDLDDKVPDHSTFSVPERKGPADDRQSA